MPTKWHPYEVVDPRSGMVFTEPGAWEYICEHLIANCPIWPVVLDHPAGRTGYQLDLPSTSGAPLIYVKLQFGSGLVFGRSFHYTRKE